MTDLIVIPYEETPKERVSLKEKKKVEVKHYEVPKVELSKNIQNFDKKPKVYTENPYSYNYVALKKEKPSVSPSASASTLIMDPTYNTVGKFLGVDTIHDWNKYYDKVYSIVEWAKAKSGQKDLGKLMEWISTKSRQVPNVGNKNIDNLYIFARLFLNK
jgi:hypothetical protein